MSLLFCDCICIGSLRCRYFRWRGSGASIWPIWIVTAKQPDLPQANGSQANGSQAMAASFRVSWLTRELAHSGNCTAIGPPSSRRMTMPLDNSTHRRAYCATSNARGIDARVLVAFARSLARVSRCRAVWRTAIGRPRPTVDDDYATDTYVYNCYVRCAKQICSGVCRYSYRFRFRSLSTCTLPCRALPCHAMPWLQWPTTSGAWGC